MKNKFECQPDYDLTDNSTFLKWLAFCCAPPILLILVCIFKNEIDLFFNSLAGHALLSLFLGFLTVYSLRWGAKRVWVRFIKK